VHLDPTRIDESGRIVNVNMSIDDEKSGMFWYELPKAVEQTLLAMLVAP
jgi:hypothetical protein